VKKKQIIAGLLEVIVVMFLLIMPATAEGDGNIDSGDGTGGSGGSGMGSGSKQNYWNNEDGCRITILCDGEKVYSMDWSNQPESSVATSFVKRNKIDYLHGSSLERATIPYTSTVVPQKMPTIVGGAGGNNIEAIKRYFTETNRIKAIAGGTGIPYDSLIGGHYKLLLEPVAYFTFKGVKYAMTATEAAKYDVLSNGQLRAWMKSLTHQNLPLSMFLEKDDTELHLQKWTGPKSGKQTDANIITYLGMGIVSFKAKEQPPDPSAYDYEFHTDTDVIVSFHLINNTGSDITPDDSAYVTLNIAGTHYNRQFVCPAGGTQLVWMRWHTPSVPQVITMTATSSQIPSLYTTLTARITQLVENLPPDPTYYDRNDGFHVAAAPSYGNNRATTWGEWYSYWHPVIVTHYDKKGNPYTVDEGYWEFAYTSYEASLSIQDHTLEPDNRCQTDYKLPSGEITMRSGYGVQVKVEPLVKGGAGVDEYDTTPVQNITATFPEFGYQGYNRMLDKINSRLWTFKQNKDSYYYSRVHYTPLWYPDDTDYAVPLFIEDAWTPGGELTATVSDSVLIYGSCLDDWYIHVTD